VKPAGDQRLFNRKRKVKDPTFFADFAAEIASNNRVNIRKLAHAHGVSTKTIHTTLHEDLNLSKKSARWVSRFFNKEMKKECVKTFKAFSAMVRHHSRRCLTRLSPWTRRVCGGLPHPQTKQQSKQWLEKGQPGPVKAKVMPGGRRWS
jgi:hypothetical protein